MSWKKHFRVVQPLNAVPTPALGKGDDHHGSEAASSNYASYLPEVYAGHPNRIQRYYQYEDMDRDSDISVALDTIADFCTQSEEQTDEPFTIRYNGEASETETKLLTTAMAKWTRINDFRSRLWYMFRNTIKNGDSFFLRDPETGEWLWVDHFSVMLVKVDEANGKTPEEYIIRGLDYAKAGKFGTRQVDSSTYNSPMGATQAFQARQASGAGLSATGSFALPGSHIDMRNRPGHANTVQDLAVVDAKHVVHLSLSVGMDIQWPFGGSLLDNIFKVYKQKELLEDSIIIYRVQRAPERRIFYIDCGTMPPVRAKAHIQQIKNEIHQRRIPNRTGGGTSIMDAAYNPLCLDMATRIPLLDGRTLSIAELADEYRAGKENWVYSCDPATGEMVPGNITWAGETRKQAKVIRLTLDNGETITCTPDHKFPVLGRGFVEAKDLTPEDSLIAFNTRKKPISTGKSVKERTYEQVYDHSKKDWVWTHRAVGEFFRTRGKHQELTFLPENAGATKTVIHHKDYDRYNNDPRNLTYMGKDDHIAFHIFNRKDWWANLPISESQRIKDQISTSLKSYYSSMCEADKELFRSLASARNAKWIAEKRINDPDGFADWRSKVGAGVSKFFQANPDKAAERAKKRLTNGHKDVYKNQSINVTQKMVRMLVDVVKAHKPSRPEASKLLSANTEFMAEFVKANPPLEGHANKIDYSSVPTQRLDLIVESAGYDGWKDFTRKVAQYNHRIVKVEEAGQIDVGTITVDGPERWHSHHTFALSAGIYTKNSIMEDYFFAQSADGRGSKVETLPGGDNLGEIGDLDFFTRKLARGLRIPPSYLALSDEQSGVSFNDGKLGAAMIQEFRFNKYCMRLQNLMAPVFDTEFKTFLRDNGINIEDSLFELQFNPPQNFTKYRQIEIDQAQAGVYQMFADNKKIAERMKFKRYLNWTDDEILENERLWKEENAKKLEKATGNTSAQSDSPAGLSAVGMRPGGDMDFGDDMGTDNPEGAEGTDGMNQAGAPGAAPGGMGGAGGMSGGAPMGGGMAPPAGGGGPLG